MTHKHTHTHYTILYYTIVLVCVSYFLAVDCLVPSKKHEGMEKELSQVNFGVSASDQFIVPASQVESQADPGTNLPALQQVCGGM